MTKPHTYAGKPLVSDGEVAAAMKRYDAKENSMTAIAKELGISTSALSQRFKRMRQSPYGLSALQPEFDRELVRQQAKQIDELQAEIQRLRGLLGDTDKPSPTRDAIMKALKNGQLYNYRDLAFMSHLTIAAVKGCIRLMPPGLYVEKMTDERGVVYVRRAQ